MAENDKPKKVKKGNAKVPFSPLGPSTAKNTSSKLTDSQLKQVLDYHNRNSKNNSATPADVDRGSFYKPQGPKPGMSASGPRVGQSGPLPSIPTPEADKKTSLRKNIKGDKKVTIMRSDDPKMVSLEVRKQALALEIKSGKKISADDMPALAGAKEKLLTRARNRAGSAGNKQQQFTKSSPGQGTPSIIPNLDDNTVANLREAHATKHSELKTNLKTAKARLDEYGPGSGRHEDHQAAFKAYNAHRAKGMRFKEKVRSQEALESVSTVRRSDDTSAPAGWGKGDDASDWQTHSKLSTSQMAAQLPAKPPVYAPGHKFAVVAKIKRQINAPDRGPSEINIVRVSNTTKGIGPKTIAPAAALEQQVTPMITNNLSGRRARLEAEFRPQNTSGEN